MPETKPVKQNNKLIITVLVIFVVALLVYIFTKNRLNNLNKEEININIEETIE